ncbi:MAG: metallophosphoesterase [Planctomycetaceae bacterium]|nr:metallophosphoesterase [Planctomycetaceae bacterium]
MILKPVSRLVQELDARSFTVIGNPCSDGLGVESFQLFRAGLTAARGDFTVVLGDISPIGRDPYYRTVAEFVDRTSPKPVHVMRGNHDGPDYDEYFGTADRAVLSEHFALIMLDNSSRTFSSGSLKFLRETLAMVQTRTIVVAFHIPPPNRITGNSMPADEWRRFEETVGVWRNRIKLLVCGHAHSYFEDEIDGLRLVVTGGGGSTINELERVSRPPHHVVEIAAEDGQLQVAVQPLAANADAMADEEAATLVRIVYSVQCDHHVTHLLDAEAALEKGHAGAAHLYRAAAQSSLAQARALYRLMGREGLLDDLGTDYTAGLAGEAIDEVLLAHALETITRAEQQYVKILSRATDGLGEGDDIPTGVYYLCGNCGYLFAGVDSPNYCTACGAPGSSFQEVK